LSIRGQEKNNELKDRRITIQMVDKPLVTVFARLIYKYDVAIGFEESMLDRDHDHYVFETNVPPHGQRVKFAGDKEFPSERSEFFEHLITVNYKDASLGNVLDDIVKQMKNYAWEINNGVVNIFPINGRNPKFEKLLNVRIREFAVPKGTEVGMIQQLILMELPEIRSFLSENNLFVDGARSTSMAFAERPLSEEIRFYDLTLKDLLNKITKSKRGGWILQNKKQKQAGDKNKDVIDILI
jgi:hypothetical protein